MAWRLFTPSPQTTWQASVGLASLVASLVSCDASGDRGGDRDGVLGVGCVHDVHGGEGGVRGGARLLLLYPQFHLSLRKVWFKIRLDSGRHDTQDSDTQHNNTQHKWQSAKKTVSITMLCYYAEFHYAVSHFIYYYDECHYAECHYSECRYAECRSAGQWLVLQTFYRCKCWS